MFDNVKVFESSEGNVWKYVFTKDDAVAEAVLYKYEDFYKRTVICCSTMSGCPVGCTFCGTGKKFIKNLNGLEIIQQIDAILKDKEITDVDFKGERLQIMFMSMGEPMLNWSSTESAIRILHEKYPHAELLLSTIGVNDDSVFNKIINLSKEISKVGLQFSIHKSNDTERNVLIPYKHKMSLTKIRDAGMMWWKETGRKPYLNYCIDGTNNTKGDKIMLCNLFSPIVFNFTFSVVCSADETMKDAGYREIDSINDFSNGMLQEGYNVRVFNPAGQDDVGGGCGMLWYVQQWMKEHDYGRNMAK